MVSMDETICMQCGDAGFSNALIHCVKCLNFAVHRYCLDMIPKTFDEFVPWLCDDCGEMERKQFLAGRLNSRYCFANGIVETVKVVAGQSASKYIIPYEDSDEIGRCRENSFQLYEQEKAKDIVAEEKEEDIVAEEKEEDIPGDDILLKDMVKWIKKKHAKLQDRPRKENMHMRKNRQW